MGIMKLSKSINWSVFKNIFFYCLLKGVEWLMQSKKQLGDQFPKEMKGLEGGVIHFSPFSLSPLSDQ